MQANRRRVLQGLAQGAAGAFVGGALWGGFLRQSRAAPTVLRPPGALADEADFARACIKCGACVSACPYDTLRLADLGEDAPAGTPTFTPRQVACAMCVDIPCVRPCPSGALDRAMQDIGAARMGVAVLDPSTCLSMQGLRCEACHRACPVIDKALRLEYRHQPRTGVHAFFEPVVDPDHCTGCGQCEHACVMDVAAIKVLPRAVALGRVGAHYRIGWEDDAPVTEGFRQGPAPAAADEAVPGLDYLNGDPP